MPTDRCAQVVEALTEALLARREPGHAELNHARQCRACGSARAELEALSRELAAAPQPELRPDVARTVREHALGELEAATAAPSNPEALPPGYRRELARILVWAAAPLPLLAIWYVWLFEYGSALLSSFLPAAAVALIGATFTIGTLSWLAAIYGSIPFVAHYRTRRRWQEMTA